MSPGGILRNAAMNNSKLIAREREARKTGDNLTDGIVIGNAVVAEREVELREPFDIVPLPSAAGGIVGIVGIVVAAISFCVSEAAALSSSCAFASSSSACGGASASLFHKGCGGRCGDGVG